MMMMLMMILRKKKRIVVVVVVLEYVVEWNVEPYLHDEVKEEVEKDFFVV